MEVVPRDVVVVGAGVAGLRVALGCAPLSVTLLTKRTFGQGGASVHAQGGIAAAVGRDDDPRIHAEDTLAVAAEIADADVVATLTRGAPREIEELLARGVRFDRTTDGQLSLGQEAAHSRSRILHAGGDRTGAEIVRALTAAVRTEKRIEVVECCFAHTLVRDGPRVVGVGATTDAAETLYLARAVVLATGGIGRAFLRTTNPPEATGDGLAMAARAGARLADLEFVQFHPTALLVDDDPLPLVSEAVRGEGALLVDGDGHRFMTALHPRAELAPRDVVARAIFERTERGIPVYLDAREAIGARFAGRFPTIFASCERGGIDPRADLIPVCAAAHYHMGGVAVDERGRTSLAGLWACGEVATTGAHGANRLASNSLLEALVFGARVAEDVRRDPSPQPSSARARELCPHATEPAVLDRHEAAAIATELRGLLWRNAGVVRSGRSLASALVDLGRLGQTVGKGASELHNLLAVGRLVATAALARRESRGAHFREDFPTRDPDFARRIFVDPSTSMS